MKKVLILEDENVLAKIYSKYLVSAGFKVKWVETVEQAENLANEFKPDLILVDHGIRGKEKAGIDLIPLVKEKLPQAKLVMLSNYSHLQLQEEVLKAGADDFLIKLNTPPKVLVEYVNNLFV